MDRSKAIKLIGFIALLVLLTLMPQALQAKWSKASTDFSYDGVSVKVTDRHQWVGTMQDTYGYATYQNDNDETVTVNWRCYGVLGDGKLVILNDNSFVMMPKKVHKEVYSYTGGNFTDRDFKKYVIAIEVIKGVELPPEPAFPTPGREITPPETPPHDEVIEVNAANADAIYERIVKRSEEGDLTQEEYKQAFLWLDYKWEVEIKELYNMYREVSVLKSRTTQAIRKREEAQKKFKIQHHDQIESWDIISNIIHYAFFHAKLNRENEGRWGNYNNNYRTPGLNIITYHN